MGDEKYLCKKHGETTESVSFIGEDGSWHHFCPICFMNFISQHIEEIHEIKEEG